MKSYVVAALASLIGVLPSPPAAGSPYRVVPLVSDLYGQAPFTDANLVNPWGIATSPTGPFCIANNRTGVSTFYSGSGQPGSLVITLPPPGGGAPPSAPTGVVFNPTSGFELLPGSPARFIFATEDGTISGWNPSVNPTAAILMVDNSGFGAVYKGLAFAMRNGNQPTLYAANFHDNRIDVFDGAWTPVALPANFTDPILPSGFGPFGIGLLGGNLLVTYAKQDANGQEVPGPGFGLIDVFDVDGNFLRRLVTQGQLNAPWGLALAPAEFGEFSGDLLVGNFGDGRINAFDSGAGTFLGALSDSTGSAISIEGLWGLIFGNGGNGGDPNTLYFTAGISGGGQIEDHGMLGAIELTGTPASVFPTPFEAIAGEDGLSLRADPSPATASTVVTFALPRDGGVKLGAFSVDGRLEAVIADAAYRAGVHRLVWRGTDDAGRPLPAGKYFLKLEAPGGTRSIPLSIVR